MVSWCCHNTSAVKAPMFSAPKTMLVYACFSNSNANSNSSKALDIPTYSERKTKVSVTAFNTSCASLATFVRKTPTGYTMLSLSVDFIFAIVFPVADCFVQRRNLRRSANTCRIRSERNRHKSDPALRSRAWVRASFYFIFVVTARGKKKGAYSHVSVRVFFSCAETANQF